MRVSTTPSVDGIAALPPLREVVARHGLTARKGLGQHFLLDLNLTRRIARAAGDLSSGTVIEIGPGPGGLTRALLLEGARHVVVVERDERCLAALMEIAAAANGRLEIVSGDAREIECATLGDRPRRIVANLPYNVATPLLLGWLDKAAAFENMVLMFQKEVADRLVAEPGTAAYGRLTVSVGWRARTRRLFDIPPRAFVPPPKVTSSLVALMPYATPRPPADPSAFETVVAAAFGQRRKMLRRALKDLPVAVDVLLERAGIDGRARAETISVDRFAALARAFSDLRADA